MATGAALKEMLWSQDGKGLFQANVFEKANNYEKTQMIDHAVTMARSAGTSRLVHDDQALYEKIRQLAIKTKQKSVELD